ncbi:gem-associated protein 8-like isoform X2 [Apostichopus japonicus]
MEVPSKVFDRSNLPETFLKLPGMNETQETSAAFQRYWQHYETMQEWMAKYVAAWKDNQTNCSTKMTRRQQAKNKLRQQTKQENMVINGTRFHGRSSGNQFPTVSENSYVEQADSGDESSEGSEFDVEVSDELKQFFIQSQKHRDERERRKQQEMRQRIEDEKKDGCKSNTEAPKERPGAKRNEEMKILYGKCTPMIQGLETAIQMEYDHVLDRKQPQLWPSIALNL